MRTVNRLGILQVARVEALGEPTKNRSEKIGRLAALALIASEPRSEHSVFSARGQTMQVVGRADALAWRAGRAPLPRKTFSARRCARLLLCHFAHARGIAILNAAPYAGGVLAKGSDSYARYAYQEASDEMLTPIRRIEAICARHEVAPGAVALQFSMRDARITSTVCGVSKPERVRQTLEWASSPIPDGVWEELKSVGYATDDPESTRVYSIG